MSQYAPAVLQTITNPDGTVSLIQVDPSNSIITLPDGTTAQVVSFTLIVYTNYILNDKKNRPSAAEKRLKPVRHLY